MVVLDHVLQPSAAGAGTEVRRSDRTKRGTRENLQGAVLIFRAGAHLGNMRYRTYRLLLPGGPTLAVVALGQ